jgi:hypothetical protein
VSTVAVDPDNWLPTFFRALKAYVETKFDLDAYEIRFGFPNDVDKLPLAKTIVHFEIDDIVYVHIGMGDQQYGGVYDETAVTITPWEAQCYEVMVDMGVWATANTGGSTARLVGTQTLFDALAGPANYKYIRTNVGIEVLGFSGGSFVMEEVSDIEIWRVVDIAMRLRIYARNILAAQTYIESFIQDQNLDIDGVTIS